MSMHPLSSSKKFTFYMSVALTLIGVDFFFLHQFSLFEQTPIAVVTVDISLFCLLVLLSFFGQRLIVRREYFISESLERYKSLFDNHPDSIISFNLDGEVLSANHGLESLLGFCQEKSQPISFLPMIHPPDLLKTLHHFQVASSGMSQNFEASFLHHNGFPIPANVTFVPTIVGNEIVGVYAILKDLTEMREQKKEIDKLYKQNQLILNSVSEGIYGIDINGRTIFWNKAAETITGWKVDEMLGRRIHNVIRPVQLDGNSESSEATSIVNSLLHPDDSLINKDLFWKKDDTSFPVEYKSSPILEGSGQLLGTVITFTDISDLKKTQELLIKSDKLSAVGQLAAGVAHEIRNPLTALKGFLKLLKANSQKEQYYIEIMQNELQRIEFIVNEFLFVSKPQATQFVTKTLHSIVMSTVELLQPQALLGNILIETEVDLTLPPVTCDEHQIKQVFINIMKNALESMTQGGNLRIQTSLNGLDDQIMIRFSDQGCGIAPERLPMLGEPFYSTKEKGTGLGLMVCYRIIEAHGGFMNIRSKLEEGTIVEIILPTTAYASKGAAIG